MMDSSKFATLGTPKPTIASRRPMLTSQKSLSNLVINTSATHKDFVKSNAKYRRLQTPPSVPTMSPEELSSKIQDSFQQFSNMLSQLSSSNNTTPTHKSTPPTSPLPTSVPPTKQKREILQDDRKPVRKPAPTSTVVQPQQQKVQKIVQKTQTVKKQQVPPKQEEQLDDVILKDVRYAIYHKSALEDVENTRLRQRLLNIWFNRAATTNDLSTMKQILSEQEIDINDLDDMGMTSFMYAAYFGYIECLKFLLNQPTLKLNQQDKKGWTALIWASHGNQLDSVKLLLEYGSDKLIKTKIGKTVFDYPTIDSIKEILGEKPPAEKISLPPPQLKTPTTPTPSKKNNGTIPYDVDFYYQTSIDGYNHYLKKGTSVSRKQSINDIQQQPQSNLTPPDFSQLMNVQHKRASVVLVEQDDEEDIKEWAESIKSLTTFDWDQCLHDQMFVFSESDVHIILDHALNVADIKALINQNKLSIELWQPANIVFLSARFAHYCYDKRLLNLLLNTTVAKLSRIIKAASRDTQTLAYWVANICQLSSYLKKDLGLCVATKESQEGLSELISEAYSYFISESQKKLEKLLDDCMMDFESFQDQVDFADDWQRFFRRSSYQPTQGKGNIDDLRKYSLDTTPASTSSLSSIDTTISSPHTMTQLLNEIQHTLQSYHVPPAIVIQAMAQFFHYLSCEIFNRVLTFKKYLCRSKALQIRMNLSVLEDWVRSSKLPTSLNQSLEPLVQLLQLLQCLSQLEDVILFSSTVQTFDKLNPLQVKRCVHNYRYEISETKLSEEVEKLANQWATDYQKEQEIIKKERASTELLQQQQEKVLVSHNEEANVDVNQARKKRPESICNLDSLLTSSAKNKSKRLSQEQLDEALVHVVSTEEKRNSKYLLPFSILNTTALLQDWTDEQVKAIKTNNIMLYSDSIYKEIKFKKQDQLNVLDKIYPEISQEWLYNLDKKLHTVK